MCGYRDTFCENIASSVEMLCRHLIDSTGKQDFSKKGHKLIKFLQHPKVEEKLSAEIIASLSVSVSVVSTYNENGEEISFNTFKYADGIREGWPHEWITPQIAAKIYNEVVPVLGELLERYS